MCPKGSLQPPATHLIIVQDTCTVEYAVSEALQEIAEHVTVTSIRRVTDRGGENWGSQVCVSSVPRDNILKLGTIKVQPARGGKCSVGSDLRKSQW